jgi:hypothetical protein
MIGWRSPAMQVSLIADPLFVDAACADFAWRIPT